jgi:hypothetical protein
MRTLAAFTAGMALVICLGWLWSLGTAGRVAVVVGVAAAVLYGVYRLALYRPDYARGAGSLDEIRGMGRLTPLGDDMPSPPAEKQGVDTEGRP